MKKLKFTKKFALQISGVPEKPKGFSQDFQALKFGEF